MFDHIGLRVRDIAKSVAFYKPALAKLGYELSSQDETSAGFGPPGAPALWLAKSNEQSRVHVCFVSPNRKSVDAFHAAGLKAGAKDNGAPGPRPDYGPTYYAAFLIDPDGNNVEAVCMKAE